MTENEHNYKGPTPMNVTYARFEIQLIDLLVPRRLKCLVENAIANDPDWWRIRLNAPAGVQGRPVQIVLLQFLILVSFTFDKLTTFRRLAKLPVAITNILKELRHDLRMCEICPVQAEATRSNGVFLSLIRLRFTPVASYSFYCSLDGQLFKAKFHAIFLDQRLQSVKNEK